MASSGIQLKPYQFQKGQSGNPSGARKRTLTKDSYARLVEKYSAYPQGQLKAILDDQETPAIEASVISQILKAIQQGNAADSLLAYSIGKPVDQTQLEVKNFDSDFDAAPRENILDLLRKDTGT